MGNSHHEEGIEVGTKHEIGNISVHFMDKMRKN